MKYDEEGRHKCTGCRACEKACPDYIIRLDITTDEDRSKYIDRWHYEIGACMMCGLCVEACPFDAIRMGHDYELAVTDPALLDSRPARRHARSPAEAQGRRARTRRRRCLIPSMQWPSASSR